jgi:glycosyltransferase involved in cell wall biosynthesis
VILQVARLEEGKGHRTMIEALGRLEDLDWECWIAGGAQRPGDRLLAGQLQKQAAEAGIGGRVRFLGERGDVADLLAASDILCHPHTTPETFGIAIVEAMAAGLPVVACDLGGPREVLEDGSGLLIPPGDAGALAEAIRQLLGDAALRQRLSVLARRRAKTFEEPGRTLKRLEQALLQIA